MSMAVDSGGRTGIAAERDIEQAVTTLKKGAYLLKYGRRGKPKFCPFRLSNDETVLIWYSGKEEKKLKLSHVSSITPGQRTAIFQRYPRPEKDCQSFSLIYNDRSLDLVCKDKDEAEVWFAGLRSLISHIHDNKKWKLQSRIDGISSATANPRTYTTNISSLSSVFDNDTCSRIPHEEIPPENGSNKAFSDVLFYSGTLDGINGNTRVSLSSAISSSSQGSGDDDADTFGDVFIWGEGTGEGVLGGGTQKVSQVLYTTKTDSLIPKALESDGILDAQYISCGRTHCSLVTKQGEIYSWGEESGGRLGHGVDSDVSQPKLIKALNNLNIELVACGEYHTCAITLSGEMYTWGDGAHNFGLLGHGSRVSHWIPRRINGPFDDIHVSSVSCGTWHTAVVTSSGKLFTFGEGTFGVLGHGDSESVAIPKEVETLKGLRTIRVSCGVWHTAAVVEIKMMGMLYTWGDGDKYRLGHGDMDPKLVPTQVDTLINANICQVGCGNCLTVVLTTSGHVYTMGSGVYGQLGNPNAKDGGKYPVRVEGMLANSFVEEISCGAYHVAVLTSRMEVYTWGKGANGRLGHGDTDDRNSPTLVEALKDKQVRSVTCGTNFTTSICVHKWASGVDQSVCSGCRLPFNYKRKRHNCYNCALVFCHTCSSRKTIKAALAPDPKKPYRVCDGCLIKLRKVWEKDILYQSFPNMEGKPNRPTSVDSLKQLESKFPSKTNRKLEFSFRSRVSPVPNVTSCSSSNWAARNMSRSFNPRFGTSTKFVSASLPGSRITSRATSPTFRHRSPPPRSTTPPRSSAIINAIGVTNDDLRKEVLQLRSQIENLTRKTQLQEVDLERTTKQLKEASAFAVEEAARCKSAREVIKMLTAQLKDVAERVPMGAMKSNNLSSLRSLGVNVVPSDVSSIKAEQVSSSVSTSYADLKIAEKQNYVTNCSQQSVLTEAGARNGSKLTGTKNSNNEADEWVVEQDEPGVYITLASLHGGVRDLKRVRFSRRRFRDKQAEQWWAENRARVYQKYNIRMVEKYSLSNIPDKHNAPGVRPLE